MKIQLNIAYDLNRKLKLQKILRNEKNLQETIVNILNEYFVFLELDKSKIIKNGSI